MRVKAIVAVVLLAVGVGAIGLVLFAPGLASSQSSSQFLTARAAVTDVTQQAVATGNLAAGAVYGLTFGQAPVVVVGTTSSSSSSSSNSGSGSLVWPVQQVAVKVGDTVKKGDVLATADPASASLQLLVAQANLSSAQARLAQDQAGATATDKAAALLSIDQARQQLSQARQSQSDTARQNQLSVQQAKASLTAAKQQLATDQAASAPASVISADQTQVAQAQTNYDNAVVKSSSSNHQAANSVANAQLSVRSAQNAYASKTQAAQPATITSDQAGVASAQASVDTAQRAVDNATLVAPVGGTVIAVNVIEGFDAGSGYAVEVATSSLVINAAFTEASISSLKVGQPASVTITSLGASADGTVTEISPVAATSGNSSVVTFNVLVTLTQPPAAARPGMSASVAVTTAQAANVLAVPAIALVGSTGNYEVRVVATNGQTTLEPVEVGLVTSSMAEITSGLSAGDTVIVGTSTQRTGTGTTSGTGLPGIFGGGGGGGRNFGGGGGTVTTP
jgi:multidrug efflux pump subunit AcrA (membrane-fusion protein)